MEKTYKIIAVDMDGTLLKSDKTIHPDSIRDVEAAVARGIHVVYCTGRALSEMRHYFALLPMIRYAVCYSGAIVYDCAEKKCICRTEIEQVYIKEIIKTVKKYRAMAHFLTETESIAAAADVSRMADFHMGVYQDMFQEVVRQVGDMEEEAKLHSFVTKINVYFRSAKERGEAYEELKQLPLTFAFAEKTSLEMTAHNVTKAAGLLRLAEHLNIPISQTAGIGDADNDRAMLDMAGFSVAMGNAGDDIKKRCDYVTKDNDHNGVGEAIRHILSAR